MLVGGFNPFENMSQIGFIFPNDRGENSKNIKQLPPPSHGCSPTRTCEVTTPCQPYGFVKDFVVFKYLPNSGGSRLRAARRLV